MSIFENANDKDIFIKNEIFGMSWNASVQHNKVYQESLNRNSRKEFKTYIQKYVEGNILPQYKNEVSETDHFKNISEVSKHAEENYNYILNNETYKIGTAQKLLNLLLKYYWCLGLVSKPPHCPIDRIILTEAGIKNINWTAIDSIECYTEIIEKIKNKINNANLSDWELSIWKRRSVTT